MIIYLLTVHLSVCGSGIMYKKEYGLQDKQFEESGSLDELKNKVLVLT